MIMADYVLTGWLFVKRIIGKFHFAELEEVKEDYNIIHRNTYIHFIYISCQSLLLVTPCYSRQQYSFFFSQPAFIVWFQHLFVLRLNLAQQKEKKHTQQETRTTEKKTEVLFCCLFIFGGGFFLSFSLLFIYSRGGNFILFIAIAYHTLSLSLSHLSDYRKCLYPFRIEQ